jgi:endonuclease/exonuclease/phosphatase (EEP) superfamily protein YafD
VVTHHEERRFFSRLIRLVFIAVSLATIMALLSPVNWFAELFSHFRFYYLLAQALLVLIFMHSGRRVLMTCTLLLAIPNAWYVVPYLMPLALESSVAAEESFDGIDVVALNVNYRNDDHASVRAYLQSMAADVIVVAEMTDAWQAALSVLDADYPHQIGRSQADPWGLRIYSRLPFVDAELLDLGVAGSVQARVVLESDGQQLQIFAVHLHSPTTPLRAAHRNGQLAELGRLLRAAQIPSAVVGDLNLTPFSPYFDSLLETANMVDARQPAGFHFTWPTHPVPLWIPIDHVLAHPALRVRNVRRGRDAGSDHYPLELSLACCVPDAG